VTKRAWIGIDLGGSKIAGGVVDVTGTSGKIALLLRKPTMQGGAPSPLTDSAPEGMAYSVPQGVEDGLMGERGHLVLASLFGLIKSLLGWAETKEYEVQGISVAAPGPLDHEKGVILNPPNIPFRNLPLKALCEKEFSIPVHLEKDTNAAAYGEYLYLTRKDAPEEGGRPLTQSRKVQRAASAHVSNQSVTNADQSKVSEYLGKTDSLLYVAVGTGIGGGFILKQKVYRGSTGIAMEIGHIVVDPQGPKCGCGASGCMEALASGTALRDSALKAGVIDSFKEQAGRHGVRGFREPSIELGPEHGYEGGHECEYIYNCIGDGMDEDEKRLAVEDRELGIVEVLTTTALYDSRAREILERAAFYLGAGISSALNLLDPGVLVLGGGVIEAASRTNSPLLDLTLKEIKSRSFRHSSLPGGIPVIISSLGEKAAILGGVALGLSK
jgi:glucokinase